jgi:hypothetical protein
MMFLSLFMAILTSKKIGVATLLVMINATVVQAQEINSYEDFKLYCSDAAYQYNVASPYCDNSKPYYQEQIQEELNRQQNINTKETEVERKEAKRKQNAVSGYAGISLGAFFPDEELLKTGFGGSVFIGSKWNKYVATDLEFIYLGGGIDIDEIDVNYSVWGLAINPRFIIPFKETDNSASLFISPGLGISSAKVETYNISVEDNTRITWQIKAGLSVPIQEKYQAFLQIRYASQFEENTVGFFGTELGFSVNFQ